MSCPFARKSSAAAASGNFSRASARSVARSQSFAAPQAASVAFHSQTEQAIVNAAQPLPVQEREQVQAGRYHGTYVNKAEVDQFRGPIPVEQYAINDDPNPEVIRKKLASLKYTQEVAVRYLNPPKPAKPGDLVIRERQAQIPAGPPVVIRQEGCAAPTPLPLVYRERPPQPPPCIPPQTIEVEGCPIPPPARKVVFEKLANLPAKPQNILIEKWLPYQPQKRRVIYQKSCVQPPPNPRNLVIEWEAPDVEVQKVCKDLGVVDADPEEYVRKYGPELKSACEIPQLCPSCPPPPPPPAPACPPPPPPPCPCAAPPSPPPAPRPCPCPSARASAPLPELEGDVFALRQVNLEAHGLAAYRRYL